MNTSIDVRKMFSSKAHVQLWTPMANTRVQSTASNSRLDNSKFLISRTNRIPLQITIKLNV